VNPVIIRVDGGSDIGMGHYKRCLTIALSLERELNVKSIFLTKSQNVVFANKKHNYETVLLSGNLGLEGDLEQAVGLISDQGARVFIIDINHSLTEEDDYLTYLRGIKESGIFSIAFDDFQVHPGFADLVVVPYVGGEVIQTDDDTESRYLLGPKFFILGREYKRAALPRKKSLMPRILICFGGADTNNWTTLVGRSLASSELQVHLNIVRGPAACNWEPTFLPYLQKSGISFRIIDSPAGLSKIMQDSTLAILSSGLTQYEAAAMGLPSVVLSLSDYHLQVTDRFASTGAALSFGLLDMHRMPEFQETVLSLAFNDERLNLMASAGVGIVDGRGIDRLIVHLKAQLL